MTTPWMHACTRCREPRLLLARINDDMLCADCWKWIGRPFPKHSVVAAEVETKARGRMVARGGTDRYRVLAGKT